MTTFNDRQTAFENKFAHDEEMAFRVEARCNKLLAIWAAEVMEKPKGELPDYIQAVIASDFEEAGHDDVIRKVTGDLGATSDEATVRSKREEFHSQAKVQLMDEA